MGNQHGKLQQNNQIGRRKKMVHWKSAEWPSAPGRPILLPSLEHQPDIVNLRWDRPKLDGGSPITGYIVEHRRMGSPHWVRSTPVPVIQCEVAISGLEPGWRYQFRVFAENVVGRSDASELSDPLTVTLQRNAITAPRFVDELQDTNAVEDERIEFRVRVFGQPTPEISWLKDGYEIFSSRRTKIVTDNDASILVIHQLALTDEGEIKCTATNRAGHAVTKANLLVQAPPKIRLPRTYEDGLIAEANEVLRLKVGIAGRPEPIIVWSHEGEEIKNGGRYEIIYTERNSLLKIDNVQRDDRGEYGIRVTNKLGEDFASFLVTVTARPNPPGQVKLSMPFNKSAILSWTAPLDDGGCKIGSYIVEYFRVGWNVWLKATTTRSLNTTLNDLIEGSEYKFRVKAENPYGVSEPSPESEVLFIPDLKRGITKPKSETRLYENTKPQKQQSSSARGKKLSPTRPQQDAATETIPIPGRRPPPQNIDIENLHMEMSYGTSNHAYIKDAGKSPLMGARFQTETTKTKEANDKKPRTPSRSPQPKISQNISMKEKQASALIRQKPIELPITPDPERKHSLTAETISSTARQRTPSPNAASQTQTAESILNETIRRQTAQSITPAKKLSAEQQNISNSSNLKQNGNNPIIEISKPPTNSSADVTATTARTSTLTESSAKNSSKPLYKKVSPPTTSNPPRMVTLGTKHEDVHNSNEFMLVVFDKNSKVNEKKKQDSFELDLEDAIQPPSISISSPDLGSLVFTNLQTFPLRRSVSSTELLYERAMQRFYEAVELEEAERTQKLRKSQEKLQQSSTLASPSVNLRKRLGSMSETERLSYERRSELRRQSSDVVNELKSSLRWTSGENISKIKPTERKAGLQIHKQESQESEDLLENQRIYNLPKRDESTDLGSDYTESTASSDMSSIEKFKMELIERTRSSSPLELETYHPRDMSAGIFTPYRAPTPDYAAVILNKPLPLPMPDFVPKPILKRSSKENFSDNEANANKNTSSQAPELEKKLDIAKGIKSFFKRDKPNTTERNTAENQLISSSKEKANTAATAAVEVETKRKAKEEEELKRKEAERIMHEEALAAVDHYSDLVSQVSKTRKVQTPLYIDSEKLKKAAEQAEREELKQQQQQTQDLSQMSKQNLLIPPSNNNKPRLSISERGQLLHVRASPSNLAVTESNISKPTTPTDMDRHEDPNGETTIISESRERRGKTQIVKVKRIIKKRVPSRSRTRDGSQSRLPYIQGVQSAESQSESFEDRGMPTIERNVETNKVETPTETVVEQACEKEAHENVHSALTYCTDLVLFLVACYVYLFKEARLVLPILALMIYRQLGEAISNWMPSWLRRKKN